MPFKKTFYPKKGKHFPNLLYAANQNFRTGRNRN